MEIKARIPGTIVAIHVKEGDAVKVKSLLAVMEAMKMEQPIVCPVEGTVREIKVSVGEKVKNGMVLMIVD